MGFNKHSDLLSLGVIFIMAWATYEILNKFSAYLHPEEIL